MIIYNSSKFKMELFFMEEINRVFWKGGLRRIDFV